MRQAIRFGDYIIRVYEMRVNSSIRVCIEWKGSYITKYDSELRALKFPQRIACYVRRYS
jgi:hypothetical protein